MKVMDVFTRISNLFKQKQPQVQGNVLPPLKVQDAISDGVIKLKFKSEQAADYCPWLETATRETVKITEIELCVFYCFLLDMLCFQHKVSDSSRMYLTSTIENALILGLVGLNGERNIQIAVRLYDLRGKLYGMRLIDSDTEWLTKAVDDLVSNIMVSMDEGHLHLNPGMPISDPITRLFYFTFLCTDLTDTKKIIDVSYIDSLALAIKNSETK